MGSHHLPITERTGLGGTGSPAQGVVGASCKAYGGPFPSENRAHWPGGDGESSPGGVRSLLPGQGGAIFLREPGAPAWGGQGVQPRGCSESPARPEGGHLLQRTGRTGPGGTGSPAQGVFGASCQANGGPSSSLNRAQRPGGDGESCPGGVRSLLPGQGGAIFFREPGAPARGGRGSPAQGVFGVSCQANGGPSSSENRAHRPGGDGECCPGGVRSLLPGQGGAIFFKEPGAPARGGRGVLPRGCSESPARPMGGHLLQRTGRTGPGGTGSPAQGVVGTSCKAHGEPSSSESRAHRPGGDGESCPGGVRSLLPGQWGALFFREPGAPARGGRGSPAQGVFGVSCQANGGPSSSENRAHRPGGDGESCPGGVRSLLQGQWGAIFFREPGAPARGGRGSPAQGVFGVSCQANGGPSSSENRAHRPGGDGESCPGGVRSLLPGQGGAIFFREPCAPARGGRGVLPRGCSESPARPMGGHLLQRTGRTGPGGTGSPAQGVFGVSCQANGGPSSSESRAHRPGGDGGVLPRGCSEPPARPMGGHLLQRTGRTGLGGTGSPAQGVFGVSCQAKGGPSSLENRAHRPGGDGESCPGGVRSLLRGQWGAIFFREPGAPAEGGRGVQPRGCSEPPARPMGGHYLRRTGRTGLGGTGSPAQGVFGVSCQAYGGPFPSENRAHRPGGDGESCPGGVRSLLPGLRGAISFREPGAPARGGRGVLPRGCSEPPARPTGGHLLQRTGRTGPGGTGIPAQGVFGASCQAYGGPSSSENRAQRPGGDGESCPGGVRSLLPGQGGAIFFREPGAPAWGGRGVLPRGCSESPARPMGGHLLQRTGRTGPGGTGSPAQGVFGVSCQAKGGPSSSENRAHRPGGDGGPAQGVFGVSYQWGAIFFREPGAPARGGRGVLPRGCSESPARPMGGHLLQRTGRTGPGGDGESCPGGVRSLLPGQWGAIFFREPGAPARGGRGVLPRGCSEPPARPVGGQYLRRTGRTGLGGTGSPAQGVFGASGTTRGYSLLPLSSSRQVSRQYRGS